MRKNRNATIELLRIVAMLMIICLHGLDKGKLLNMYFGSGNAAFMGSWLLESVCIVGLNMYMMISGYYMIESKLRPGRLLEIVLTVLYYSVGILGVFLLLSKALGLFELSVTLNDIFKCVLPLHMETYWFCTAFVIFYLFLPVLKTGVKSMSRKALLTVIAMLIIFETAFKSVFPVLFEIDDKGYSALWFITLFLIAAYIRLYGIRLLNTSLKGMILYIVSVIMIFAEEIALQFIINRFGRLELMERISYDYNHVFVLLASLGLFTAFINAGEIKGKVAGVIGILSAGSFGVYLIHEHIFIRFRWPEWLGLNELSARNPIILILWVLCASILVYIVCALIDIPRQVLFRLCSGKLSKSPLGRKIKKLDDELNASS